LPATGQKFFAIDITKIELRRESMSRFRKAMLLAVCGDTEKGKHERLEVRHRHFNSSVALNLYSPEVPSMAMGPKAGGLIPLRECTAGSDSFCLTSAAVC
jgi:hypothetical protein